MEPSGDGYRGRYSGGPARSGPLMLQAGAFVMVVGVKAIGAAPFISFFVNQVHTAVPTMEAFDIRGLSPSAWNLSACGQLSVLTSGRVISTSGGRSAIGFFGRP